MNRHTNDIVLETSDLKNLWNANLRNANLWNADLRYADLRDADLRNVNLWNADLRDANLRDADLPPFQIPEGELIVYKKLTHETIATLKIESHFERTGTLVGRKCRCSGALVLSLSPAMSKQSGIHDSSLVYKVGEYTYPDKYDPDPRIECTNGIHFFLTREEAERH